ncbi:MAG: glycosyltransferase [Candidatus Margulisiibacteriota bacterium]
MRIAFFCDSYKPYLSGVTNSVELLVNELRALGHKVYIFAPRYPGHVDTDPDIIRFPSLPTGYPNFRLALPYINRIPDVDLVHSHSPFQAGLLAKYVAHKRRVPFVYTFHTLFTRYVHYAHFLPEPLSKMSLVGYARQFCRRCDLIITPSKMAKRVLLSWKIKNNTAVVPTGVDFEQLKKIPPDSREALRKKFKIPGEAKVLIYVGRLSKEKNVPFLINAFKKIPDAYLVLVGGGPLLEEIKKMKIKNLILTGEVGYPEVLSYYLIGDIFVFASITETQGMVLAEAKACGLPVVALFAGGLVDTVRSGIDGYLAPRSGDKFIVHLKRLLNDGALLKKMGLAAREDAEERFSSKVYGEKIEALYSTLAR